MLGRSKGKNHQRQLYWTKSKWLESKSVVLVILDAPARLLPCFMTLASLIYHSTYQHLYIKTPFGWFSVKMFSKFWGPPLSSPVDSHLWFYQAMNGPKNTLIKICPKNTTMLNFPLICNAMGVQCLTWQTILEAWQVALKVPGTRSPLPFLVAFSGNWELK